MGLLDILGCQYVIDHVLLTYKKHEENKAYKAYLADTLYAICNNATQVGDTREYVKINKRWMDILTPKPESNLEVIDMRDCRQVVDEMWGRICGEGVINGPV